MKHLFLINPRAGKFDRSQEIVGRVEALAKEQGLDCTAVVTRYVGHARELAQQAAAAGAPVRIYACGGDGTLSEAASGAAGFENAAVSTYPMGSGNDFVRMFGPGEAKFHDLAALATGPQSPIDMIDCNGQLSLNVCSVGFDARIGMRVQDFKALPLVSGPLAYQLSAVRTIIEGIHRPYRVEVDGEVLPGREYTLICACNGRYYGGGFKPARNAMPDDGLLDFVIVKGVSRLMILSLISKYARGEADQIPQIIMRRGKSLKITCEQTEMVNVDGERLDADVISMGLSAKKTNFFYPAGTHWNPALRW